MKRNKHHSPEIRKQQILLASEIVLLKEGIESFTIDQVVFHAQIAKGTVYKYYKNKDHLFAELAVKSVEMLYQYFRTAVADIESPIQKLQSVIKSCYRFYHDYPQYYGLLNYFERKEVDAVQRGRYQKISFELQSFIEKIIDEGKAMGEISGKVPTQSIDYIIWSGTIGMIQFIESKKELIPDLKVINQEKLIHDFALIITSGLRI
ncbi:TetR/AcrR family transcriptional regulator [Algoriphagus antarcticus]|uniref:TetR family transcriptional regulator n=1 Tax=Algoriphagus antarcticus TaxID=238540 RepID=A0A3E0D7A3_9BACT|nr:TetR/AcrR family transcriptional regulator [Algoriphagus antarcticus]REG78373.1 TetR family transcriptional regulator [Algoriphagus antarcticus]